MSNYDPEYIAEMEYEYKIQQQDLKREVYSEEYLANLDEDDEDEEWSCPDCGRYSCSGNCPL